MISTSVGLPRRSVRSIFISDVHLGCKYSHAEAFLDFLEYHDPENVYIVGDFIDGWRLKKNWYWTETNNRVLRHLIEMAECGVKLIYTPGNHDEFLRGFLYDFDLVEIADEVVHTTADGRRFYVAHGDRFDHVERCAKWLSVLGSFGYDLLCWGNKRINRIRQLFQLKAYNFSAWAKRRVKRAVQFVSDFEDRIIGHARSLACDGVICGHIHTPTISDGGDLLYCNTGDWVENCTAIVEHLDGKLELVRWRREKPQPEIPATVRLPRPRAAVGYAQVAAG